MSYDAWKTSGPHEDMPSVESERCDCCSEPGAWSPETPPGRRRILLCEEHATRWLKGEADLRAELEEVAGREPLPLATSALFGLARALDGRAPRKGKRSA